MSEATHNKRELTMLVSNAEGPRDITSFDFQHRVFKTSGARFVLKGQSKTPSFCVDMGGLVGVIEIDALRKEFGITTDSEDGRLIDTAVAGLRYVPDIKPGDAIPSELLNGTASWQISVKHKKIAEQRLQIQLLSWVGGKEILITDPKEITLFLEQIENKEKLRTAFRNAAEALGYENNNVDPVISRIELLAREICYIEALRDRFALIPVIDQKVQNILASLGGDRNAKMEVNRIRVLLQSGIKEYSAIFAEADAQTGEIIAALKTIDRQTQFIRNNRDRLRFLLMEWEPHISSLKDWHTRRTPQTEKLLSELYRFLAPRFSSARSILRQKSLQAAPKMDTKTE